MSTPLQNLNARPVLLVDNLGRRVVDPDGGYIGVPGSFSRNRVVSALPLANGPRLLVKPVVVHDQLLSYLGDPAGNLIGVPGQWVSRLISARWTENTRQIAG